MPDRALAQRVGSAELLEAPVTIGSTDPTQPSTAVEERERFLYSTGEQKIGNRAYEIYLQRGAQPGYELEDWLRPNVSSIHNRASRHREHRRFGIESSSQWVMRWATYSPPSSPAWEAWIRSLGSSQVVATAVPRQSPFLGPFMVQ